jgi:hypothetical protein
MHSLKASVISTLLGIVGIVLAMPAVVHGNETGKSGRIPMPAISSPEGKKCVEPPEVMRRDHMKFILHQRDDTMHEGIRTTKYSLKNCVNCHADEKTGSVLGEKGFCSSCHRYAAVHIDCFSCHTDKREKNAVATVPKMPASGANHEVKP